MSLQGAPALPSEPPSQPYDWHNVRIGGGGFVSGLAFHPAQRGLAYARTDVGGAYRWDDDKACWTPLLDGLGMDDVNLTGVESLALDPGDPSRLYLAVGTYTNPRVGNGAILSSADQGRTFHRCNMPFRMGANEAGRGNGERLAVDPNDGAILFFGSRDAGLWRSADHGRSWARIDSFPAAATSEEASAQGGRLRQPLGICFVLFDVRSSGPGSPTQTLYAGISMRHQPLWRSTDGGLTWSPVPGQPEGLRPTRPCLAADGTLYLTYGDEPGPNAMTDGAVWKLDTRTGTWTDITPLRPGNGGNRFGYGAVSADASRPGRLLVSTFCRYKPDHDEVFLSTDDGHSWQPVLEHSRMDHSQAPWCDQHTPHWIADLRIDPFNSSHALFVTGYGVYRTRNLEALEHGGTVSWVFDDAGLEETVPLALLSPPEGAHLLSALGDIDGFRHDSLETAGTAFAGPPRYANAEDIACASGKPSMIVRCGTVRNRTAEVRIAVSEDGGLSWRALATEPEGAYGAGRVALSADGKVIAWTPRAHPPAGATGYDLWRPWPGRPTVTSDQGRSWQVCEGLPLGCALIADPSATDRFLAYDARSGTLFESTDAGLHFQPRCTGLPSVRPLPGGFGGNTEPGILHAVPGVRDEFWLETRNEGLCVSRDGGRSFEKLPGVAEAYSLGFGKAAPGATHPTLFLAGRIGDTKGLFRSDDSGAHWVELSDDRHRFGWINHVTGDPRLFGRVYFGTGGRGILYGDPKP
jgi:photosystem II stability/assembly factor-like uncharacterized protein